MTAITFFSRSFFSYFFSSRVQKGLLSRFNQGSSIINVYKIVTVVLSNKIFQRKQAPLFWILEMQNNKCQIERMTELQRFIAPLQFFKLCKNQSFETNTFAQRFIFRKLACAGFQYTWIWWEGVVTSTKHVFFFQVNLLCMIFFGYMMFAGFFILNITLELFCVFRNTEYNVSKYAHFS